MHVPRFHGAHALAGLVLLGACYTYAPMQGAALLPGERVRLRVTAVTAEALEPVLGRADARLLTGEVITAGADTLIVQVPTDVTAVGTGSYQTLHQRVAIPRDAVLEVERRTLDRQRTTVAVGVVTAMLGAVVLRATVLQPGKSGPPGGGSPPELVPRYR